jgi:hypothetical protein
MASKQSTAAKSNNAVILYPLILYTIMITLVVDPKHFNMTRIAYPTVRHDPEPVISTFHPS